MGRRERPINPAAGPLQAFADELRELRKAAGSPTYRELARRAHFSGTTLSVAASGVSLPSLQVTLGYVRACRGDVGEWEQRWRRTARQLGADSEAGPLAVSQSAAEPRAATAGEANGRAGGNVDALHDGIGNGGQAGVASGAPPAGVGPASAASRHGVIPAQLPCAVADFTGRASELRELDAILDDERTPPAWLRIAVIAGAPGVGKTALAVRWAHQVSGRFPDGQLHVNLRGFDPSGQPVTPTTAIRGFLDALGIPSARIPAAIDAQAGLYRSLLADKRVLVLLDNAADVSQIRPLLPGSPGCAVVVTSRSDLAGLAAAEGARLLTLDLLTNDEAHQLLTRRLGASSVSAEPAAVRDLIQLCGRLPLALGIAVAYAATRPRLPLAATTEDLRGSGRLLDALDTGDATTSLRAVFSWSYRNLTAPAARVFRLLGIHCGPDISLPAAASLAGLPTTRAHRALAELTRAHLITENAPGRYACHDLLRAYAAEQATRLDSSAHRRAAVHRMLDHYLRTAHTAAQLLNPDPVEGPIALPQPAPGVIAEQPADYTAASAWFEAERPVLLAAIQRAAAGWDIHAWQLAMALTDYLQRQGRWEDWATTQHAALTAARNRADRPGQAHAHAGIGRACGWLGRDREAHGHLRQALTLFTELGDQPAQATVRMDIARQFGHQGSPAEALAESQQALSLYRAAGHRRGQASALNNIGWYHTQLGNHGDALAYCQQALALHREIGDRHAEAATLDSLGCAHHHLGHHQRATTCFQQTLAIMSELGGDPYHQAIALRHLGDSYHAAGDPAAARAAWQQALEMLSQLGHRDASQIRAKLRDLDASQTDSLDCGIPPAAPGLGDAELSQPRVV